VTHKIARIVLFAAAATVLSMSSAMAADCVTGTLASYEALGSTGCTIGGFTFFNFSLVSDTSSMPPAPITAADIQVQGFGPNSPADGESVPDGPGLGNDVGVEFTANWITAAGEFEDDNIDFDVAVGSTNVDITDAGLVQEGQNASVSEIGCSGITTCSQVWGVDTNDGSPISDKIFSATGSLSVGKDIQVEGNGTLSAVYDGFSYTQVPEPRAVSLLLGLGLVAAFVLRKKFQGANA
jgi:hypothetical protein